MTDYSVLSDISINAMVSRKLYGELSHDHRLELVNQVVDYCNKPDDAMPIIIENKISIVSTDSSWIALPDNAAIDEITGDATEMIYADDSCVIHANPFRAAMIVFLQMQENNHD